MSATKTIICDIDGTLLLHKGTLYTQLSDPTILNGVRNKFIEWDTKEYRIILITGRRESTRKITEKQLSDLGIFYDLLIMGVGPGDRYLINDKKPDGRDTAFAINIDRNIGIENIDI